jgi:hypothetical protein
MSMWSDSGWIKIDIEQQDIDEAFERSSSHCAVAMAIARTLPDARRIAVDLQTIRWTMKKKGLRFVCLTPHCAQDAIVAFDQGEREKLQPFTMRMRPAQISKAGKKRRECPTNGELRGSGLTLAKDQPHLAAAARGLIEGLAGTSSSPQRFTADGERNLDPDRSDGLVEPKKRRPMTTDGLLPPKLRKPRRKVSTAAKGTIPTTLGGKLPPVSILSRREFGLRTLRR